MAHKSSVKDSADAQAVDGCSLMKIRHLIPELHFIIVLVADSEFTSMFQVLKLKKKARTGLLLLHVRTPSVTKAEGTGESDSSRET